MLQELINTVLQLIGFSLIPLIVYFIWFRKKTSFWRYIGLYRAPMKTNLKALAVSLLFLVPAVVMFLMNDDFHRALLHHKSMTGRIAQLGLTFETVGILLLTSLMKTSFSEEILFRGFVAKRLIAWMGYLWGNILQALFFGAIHILIFLQITSDPLFLTVMLIVPSVGAFVSVYLNEKEAGGSIIPGWIAHATANLASYSLIGLFLA